MEWTGRAPSALRLKKSRIVSICCVVRRCHLQPTLLSRGAPLRRQAFAFGSPLRGDGLDCSRLPRSRLFVLRMPTNVPPRQPFRHLEDTIMIAINTDIIIANIGVDIGKNAFHICAMNAKGTIVRRERLTRAALPKRLANIPPCLIGMEACAGAHHIGRKLASLGHDVRLMPAKYVKPFLKGHKNDYRDAEAIAEAVQRPTMHFVAIKTPEQMDLLALHRVRSRLVGQRTGVINQIRGFLVERGITVRQGVVPLRKALPDILSSQTGPLSPRMIGLLTDLAQDWRRLDERIATVSAEIESLAEQGNSCQRLMTVPGVGPIISSAVVAAIGNGVGFKQG